MSTPSFKGETNNNNGLRLYWCNNHIYGAIWSYSRPACVHCRFTSFTKFWCLKFDEQVHKLSTMWSFSMTTHMATSVMTIFQEYSWEVLNHPPYSPDLSAPDYDLFPKLKEPLQGIRFSNLNEMSLAVTREISRLIKNQFLHGIERLPECWRACISHEGDYIERL